MTLFVGEFINECVNLCIKVQNQSGKKLGI